MPRVYFHWSLFNCCFVKGVYPGKCAQVLICPVKISVLLTAQCVRVLL